ncbi:Zinc finger SWIM-type domain-containing protein [Cryptosporidium felis]|nr:Zinc finger SWIM-type domain-containing protein [Cryptosporidium felis]
MPSPGSTMSSMLKYSFVKNHDHLNSLLGLIKEFKPIGDLSSQTLEDISSDLNHNLGITKIISEICPTLLEKAISLIDNTKINVYIEVNSRRRFYIMGATKEDDLNYLVMRHFCTCRSFIDKVVLQKKEITCKHELAYYIIDSIYVSDICSKLTLEYKSDGIRGKGDCEERVFSISTINPLIKIYLISEREFSETYLDYSSRFLVENNLLNGVQRRM